MTPYNNIHQLKRYFITLVVLHNVIFYTQQMSVQTFYSLFLLPLKFSLKVVFLW